MGLSRREILYRLGGLGGYATAYAAMNVLGLMPQEARAGPLDLPPDLGKGQSVIVLGAGIAGLVSAYELERVGFSVTLIEARDRVGGRNWTLRDGDKVAMLGEAEQKVSFSEGVYMNAGPARIPSHHQALLSYCRRLGVPLEVEVNSSRGAYIWSEESNGGKPIRMRQAINDTRGHIAELLSKAINRGALDQDLSLEDKEKLLPFLRAYGDLDANSAFKATARSGYAISPGAAMQLAEPVAPLPLSTLLDNKQLPLTLFEDVLDMQATMFQPVGGMDRIPAGFAAQIKSPILLGCDVREIRTPNGKVRVVYREKNGATRVIEAQHAIVTMPLPVLAKTKADFEKPVRQAIASCIYDHSNKIGFEAPRFWEAEQIYGGISFVGGETSLIWYPSAGLGAERGMLLACYGSGKDAAVFAKRPLAEQIAMAKAAVGRVHPGQDSVLERPVVVNWTKVPFSLGPWPHWMPGDERAERIDTPAFRLLNEPQGPIHFAGAHLSQMPGWQEGAILSAHRVIARLATRAQAT